MDAVSPASPLCLSHFRSPSSPFSSSLSLSLTLSFLPFFSLSLSSFHALSCSRSLSRTFPLLVLPSRFSVLFRARLSQPFYFAISFPRQRSFFFPLSDLYARSFPPPPPFPPTALPTSPLFRRPLRARFSGFSCAPFRPPAYPLRNRSTETCSGVAGTSENATEGNGVAYEIRAI